MDVEAASSAITMRIEKAKIVVVTVTVVELYKKDRPDFSHAAIWMPKSRIVSRTPMSIRMSAGIVVFCNVAVSIIPSILSFRFYLFVSVWGLPVTAGTIQRSRPAAAATLGEATTSSSTRVFRFVE